MNAPKNIADLLKENGRIVHENERLEQVNADLMEVLEAIINYEVNPDFDFTRWKRVIDSAAAALARAKGETK